MHQVNSLSSTQRKNISFYVKNFKPKLIRDLRQYSTITVCKEMNICCIDTNFKGRVSFHPLFGGIISWNWYIIYPIQMIIACFVNHFDHETKLRLSTPLFLRVFFLNGNCWVLVTLWTQTLIPHIEDSKQ